MRIIKKLSKKEAEMLLPKGLKDALSADPDEVFYCMGCDGLRSKKHNCVPPYPIKTKANKRIEPIQ